MNTPFVAVAMFTFNHDAFISQAIDGVLNQKSEFPIKLYIGDDCSTDRTTEICRRYADDNPDKIDLFVNDENDIRKNVKTVMNRCLESGAAYFAICEGDDYWTDVKKLQLQVDFLEAHKNYAMCCHGVHCFDQRLGEFTSSILKPTYMKDRNHYDFNDFLCDSSLAPPCSVVVRNETFIPDWFYDDLIGDWGLYLLVMRSGGKVHVMDRYMACYRVHGRGVGSSRSATTGIQRTLDLYKKVDKHMNLAGFESYQRGLLKYKTHWLQNAYDICGITTMSEKTKALFLVVREKLINVDHAKIVIYCTDNELSVIKPFLNLWQMEGLKGIPEIVGFTNQQLDREYVSDGIHSIPLNELDETQASALVVCAFETYEYTRAFLAKAKLPNLPVIDLLSDVVPYLRLASEESDLERHARLAIIERRNDLSHLERQMIAIVEERVIRRLAELTGDYVLFGAGKHTRWLLTLIEKHTLNRPSVIIDDAPKSDEILGTPVVATEVAKLNDDVTIVTSTDTLQDVFKVRCAAAFGARKIVDLYEGMPMGPYPKNQSF